MNRTLQTNNTTTKDRLFLGLDLYIILPQSKSSLLYLLYVVSLLSFLGKILVFVLL